MEHGLDPFEQTVTRAEALANSNLGKYKRNLILFAALGYLIIFLAIGILLGLTGGIIAIAFFSTSLFFILLKKKVLFLVIPSIWLMLKALWVRLEAPEGYTLERASCPVLFKEIDLLCKALKTKKIHEVILTPEFNASITQTPRLGIFGWDKNTLVIGLQLLMSLSPEQAKAVLAHELGHLSGNHSRFSGWIYRVRSSWHRIMTALDEARSVGAKVMGWFFDWYSPRFAAYSFTLARANEYEADKLAAGLTSPLTMANALMHTHITDTYISENYWDPYFKKADIMEVPPNGPWSGLLGFVSENRPTDAFLEERLKERLGQETDLTDTHPCLKDRLAALRVPANPPLPNDETAAAVWFDDNYSSIIREFDQDWLSQNTEKWKARYTYVLESKATIEKRALEDVATMSDEDLWQFSILTEEFESSQKAHALFLEYQKRHPDDADAAFMLGKILYGQQDEKMLDQMKIALNSPVLVNDACRLSFYFLTDRGRHEEAEWWRRQAEVQMQVDEESEQERAFLELGDELVKVTIDPEMRAYIQKTLEENEEIDKVWLAEKPARHYSDIPILAMTVQFKTFLREDEVRIDEINEALDLNCTLFIFPWPGEYNHLAKKVIKNGERLI